MAEQASPFITFYKQGWENYQHAFAETIAPLSSEQLALPLAPHHWSIGRLLIHMIDARVWWFHMWMGEGNPELAHWNDDEDNDEQTVREAAELVAMFEKTWHMIADALARWTSADLEHLFPPPTFMREEEPPHTRQWIVWHVLEHEIHHGGELSLALGTYGLESFYTW